MATLTKRTGNRTTRNIAERQALVISAQYGAGLQNHRVVSAKMVVKAKDATANGSGIFYGLLIDRAEMRRLAVVLAGHLTSHTNGLVNDRRTDAQKLMALAHAVNEPERERALELTA